MLGSLGPRWKLPCFNHKLQIIMSGYGAVVCKSPISMHFPTYGSFLTPCFLTPPFFTDEYYNWLHHSQGLASIVICPQLVNPHVSFSWVTHIIHSLPFFDIFCLIFITKRYNLESLTADIYFLLVVLMRSQCSRCLHDVVLPSVCCEYRWLVKELLWPIVEL